MTNSLVVMDSRGSVLATSGLPETLGVADVDAAYQTKLEDLVEPTNGTSLEAILAQAAGAPHSPRRLPACGRPRSRS